ncbi:MAG: metallophosphoesterase [Planctomycetaceae bacterium]|nr:metallophosphoesterase [Planctomycetaceae bacterium]
MNRRVLLPLCLLMLTAVVAASGDAWAEPWKFVVMADSQSGGDDNDNGVGTRTLGAVAKDVATNVKPDLVLFAGDLVQGAGDEAGLESQLMTFRKTMAPVYDANIPVYAIRGSHDTGPNEYRPWGLAVWNKVFSGRYAMPTNGPDGEKGCTYSVKHKNAMFIGMDCYSALDTMTLNLPWVKKQLDTNTQPHVFSFSHTQIKRVEHTESLDNLPAIRNPLVAMLRAAGGRTYFCGHMHLANVTALNDTQADPQNKSLDDDFFQVICPPAGRKFYIWPAKYVGNPIPGLKPHLIINRHKRPGYTVVTVDGPAVDIKFMLQSGDKFEPLPAVKYSVKPTTQPAAAQPASPADAQAQPSR